MKFFVHVEVRGLDAIADPEGQTIERALPVLGFRGVERVHVGKVVRFELEADDKDTARRMANEMCERLLANPVIERYQVSIDESSTPNAS